MKKIRICKQCGKEFIGKDNGKEKKRLFCSADCFFKWHCKDIIKSDEL